MAVNIAIAYSKVAPEDPIIGSLMANWTQEGNMRTIIIGASSLLSL